ncbi:MDR family MFS transporter [Amycolatopsis lexingtonensis]|uniref:MDR family MFS transporter n=1 Tax=Amycolatopsis lexingtonensis TaxID=218822 RepID=UPI003F711379
MMHVSAPEEADPGRLYLPKRRVTAVMSGLMLGVLLAALDETIVAAAGKMIADELHGQSLQAWATTAYLITATVSMPLYGKLSDTFGRKPMYLSAISVFLVGSLAAGAAGSMYELAAFRAVQGLGAGGLMSLALAIITDIAPPRQRGKYQGCFTAVFAVASVAGPLVGGLFADAHTVAGVSGWRWVFLVNFPVGVLALVVINRVLDLPRPRTPQRVDFLGAGALVLGVVPLLVVAERGAEWGWTSAASVAMYFAGTSGVLLFLLQERRWGDAALLPLRLFRYAGYRIATVVTVVQGIGMFGAVTSVPLYLQIVKGQTPTEAGLQLLPLTLGITIASTASGWVTARTGRYKTAAVAGLGSVAVALFALATVGVDTPPAVVSAIVLVIGLGLGMSMLTLLSAATNGVAAQDVGIAMSSSTFFRQIGGTAGIAVFLSILFGTVSGRIVEQVRAAASSPDYAAALARQPSYAERWRSGIDVDDTSFLHGLDPVLARPILEGFAGSLRLVFLIGGLVVAISFALAWALPETPLAEAPLPSPSPITPQPGRAGPSEGDDPARSSCSAALKPGGRTGRTASSAVS